MDPLLYHLWVHKAILQRLCGQWELFFTPACPRLLPEDMSSAPSLWHQGRCTGHTGWGPKPLTLNFQPWDSSVLGLLQTPVLFLDSTDTQGSAGALQIETFQIKLCRCKYISNFRTAFCYLIGDQHKLGPLPTKLTGSDRFTLIRPVLQNKIT